MAGVPTNFQAISNVLANYNFVDIASGTGYINFYAGDTVDKKLLSNFTYYSSSYIETVTNKNVNYTLFSDVDFDTTLNRPMDLNGLGIINVPVLLTNNIGPGNTTYIKIVATLRKWDGAVETDIIANEEEHTLLYNVATISVYKMLSIDLDIPTTHFKKGETLRLNISAYYKTSGVGGDGVFSYAFDPMSRTDGWDSTGAVPSKLLFQCPVRLNL